MSALDRPLVSVGLPVFNGDDYLAETIDSILAQTNPDLELILCDNASTDRTQAICEDYAAKDPRVRYFRQPKNMGAAHNYNTAWHMARGKYWRWAAHDDLVAPTYHERLVEVLESDPGCVLVHPGTVIIDAEGREVQCYVDRLESFSDDPVERFATWMARGNKGQCNPFFGLMRPEVVETTGLHPDYPGSDHVFVAEMTLRGRCRMVREGLFFRRIHEKNSVRANPDHRDLAAWFTGAKPKGLTFKMIRLTRGFVQAINLAPLSFGQRLACYRILYGWTWRYRTMIIRELMIPFYMNGQTTKLGQWISRFLGLRKLGQG